MSFSSYKALYQCQLLLQQTILWNQQNTQLNSNEQGFLQTLTLCPHLPQPLTQHNHEMMNIDTHSLSPVFMPNSSASCFLGMSKAPHNLPVLCKNPKLLPLLLRTKLSDTLAMNLIRTSGLRYDSSQQHVFFATQHLSTDQISYLTRGTLIKEISGNRGRYMVPKKKFFIAEPFKMLQLLPLPLFKGHPASDWVFYCCCCSFFNMTFFACFQNGSNLQ